MIFTLFNRVLWALEGQATYSQKTFRETGKLRTKIEFVSIWAPNATKFIIGREDRPAELNVFK